LIKHHQFYLATNRFQYESVESYQNRLILRTMLQTLQKRIHCTKSKWTVTSIHYAISIICKRLLIPLFLVHLSMVHTYNEFTTSDVDLPISLHKGTRNYTRHPLSNFVWYAYISTSYCSFLSSIDA